MLKVNLQWLWGVCILIFNIGGRSSSHSSLSAGGGCDYIVRALRCSMKGIGKIPACNIIVGPGNQWVTAAKSLVQGQVVFFVKIPERW